MIGIIPLYKPRGMTSHDCVFKIRKILGTKKVGHTGTLDPGVDGVLPICVGEATKIIPYVGAFKKEYIATVKLGETTTTEDAEGEIVHSEVIEQMPTKESIEAVLKQFTGKIKQIPPMYSAVKVKGKKLYEYAREGIEVERPEREIEIFELELIEVFDDSFKIRVKCSKGTYVRTLCVDIGKALGHYAHMSKLTRTESDHILLKDTVTFSDLEHNPFESCTFPINDFLTHIPSIAVKKNEIENIMNGQRYFYPNQNATHYKLMYDNILLGIFVQDPKNEKLLKPKRVFRIYYEEGVSNENN